VTIERLQAHYGLSRMPFGRDLAPGMLHRAVARGLRRYWVERRLPESQKTRQTTSRTISAAYHSMPPPPVAKE
jgi:hypothetical protein